MCIANNMQMSYVIYLTAGINSAQTDVSRHDHDVCARSLAQAGDPWKLCDDGASVVPSKTQKG